MTANITSVTVFFENGLKREEYGPTKKSSVSLTAAVAENEDGAIILNVLGAMALAKVADLLSAPQPDTVASASIEQANTGGEPPARRGRGPNKPKDEQAGAPAAGGQTAPAVEPEAASEPLSSETDDWSAGAEDTQITDQEILSATSKRAGEIGARDPIVKLIASFATRTEGAPFKVQEIPQNQRKDYLSKLAALTA